MVRLNLQLFAKSINEIAKEVIKGNWGNGNERKTKLTQAGYNYSEVQSVVNSMLKGNNTQTTTTTKKNNTGTTAKNNKNTTATPTNTNSNIDIKGVDKSVVNTMTSNYTESDNLKGLNQEADSTYDNYKALASTPFDSEAYNQAMKYTNELLEKLNSGKTSYTDQIKDMISQIMNREDFEYDVDKDTLFQQALASAMGSGRTAMQDTIGQASALTGGYGSTYATSAGNQAYNAYIEDAYNNLPEYYNMALQAYQMEGQEMYQQLDMLNAADAAEWGRTYDAWQSNFANAQQIYNQEYNAWADSIDNAYNLYMASKESADSLYAKEYQTWQDKVTNATQLAGIQNSDYWNNQEMQYKNATLAEEKRQFNYSIGDTNNDGVVSDAEKAAMAVTSSQNGYVTKTDEKGNTVTYKEATEAQKKKALEAYNEGGTAALNKYVDSLPSNIDMDGIDAYVNEYGQLPLEQRTYTKTKDTTNWLWGVDKNDVVEDQYDNKYKIKDLPKSIQSALTKLKENESYTKK